MQVAIWQGLSQIWPSSPDVGYRGNDIAIQFPESYELPVNEDLLTLVGWSEDDTFSHTIDFRFTVESLAQARERSGIMEFLARFREMVGL